MHTPEQLKDLVVHSLEEIQAQDIQVLDVSQISSFTDYMVIATGRSDRHVKAVADSVMMQLLEKEGIKPIGKEGFDTAQWVLLDFDDVVIHVMRAESREFYDLDGLWGEQVKKMVARHREEAS